jgi:hypothetical protein
VRGLLTRQGHHQRIVLVRDRPGEQLDVLGTHTVPGKPDEHAGLGVHRQADRATHVREACQPVETGLRAPGQVLVMNKEGLEQLERAEALTVAIGTRDGADRT